MKINYFTGLRNLEPKSMQIYKSHLLAEINNLDPSFTYSEYAMKHYELNIHRFHFDRMFNRFITLQFAARFHYGKINHVLDHTYACAVNLLPRNVKNIVTVHDLFLLKGKINLFRMFSVPGIKKADKIIAESESTKKELIKLLHISENKIEVIYNGVDKTIFKTISAEGKFPELVNNTVLLNVANHEDRKNTITIVKILKELLKLFPNLILVRVGNESIKTTRMIKELHLENKVYYYQNIDTNHLVALYNLASIFVFPSLKEGFGLPVLEAMACSCPVITSNIYSLPEVAGNAAILVNPLDEQEIMIATKKVLSDKKLRKKMMARGLEQAGRFSWEKTAEKTLKLYREII